MKMMKKLLLFTLTVFLVSVNAFSQLIHDFQTNTIGEVLPYETGWVAAEIVVDVVDDPLSPGNNVMRQINSGWNAAPALRFVIPEGRTLADYSQFRFRGYFTAGDLGWKRIRVLAYTSVPAGPFEHANQQGVEIGNFFRAVGPPGVSTAWEDITIDIAGSAAITGTVYLAFGFNNSGSTWFADNVELVHIPLTGITVTAPNDSILVDDGTMQMAATVAPANASNRAVTWSVSNPAIATISATGLLTAVNNGTVTVTATSVSNPTVTGTMDIAVVNQRIQVTGITVTSPAETLTIVGGRMRMVATVVPADATNRAVTWSVSPAGAATISATGMLTALANGTVVVTATSVSDPAVSGTRTITVNIVPLSVITRETFGSTVWDTGATPPKTDGHAGHFKATEITSFTSTNGNIVGGSDNSVRINFYDDARVATKPAYWRNPAGIHQLHMGARPTGWLGSWDTTVFRNINIVGSTVLSIEFGYQRARWPAPGTTTRSLNVQYRVDGGAWAQLDTSLIVPENLVLRWDYIVMPVNITGTTLDIRFAAIENEMQIYIDDITVMGIVPVTGVTVTAPNDSILVDDGTMQMAAIVAPANATIPAVTWSVNTPAVATISATGLLTAVSNGTVTVTATSVANSAITGTMDIAVVNQVIPVTGITVASPADTIKVAGGTLQMDATVLPANATNPAVTWSVDVPPAIATISPAGLLTAVANGEVVVTASSVSNPGVSGSRTITVNIPGAVQPILFYDFENYNIDEVLPFETGWGAGDITVTVVDDPLSPGTGNNVIRTVTTNWNAAPALMFVLPAGRNLAEYSQLRFRGHFATGDVGWKLISVVAYTAVPTGAFPAGGQGVTIGSYNRARAASTAWEDIRINIAGSSAITDTVYLAFGFNNSGSTWFADDVQLVLNVPVTGITVTAPNDSILVDDGTLQMVATAAPANATIPAVTWSVNTPAVATISAAGLLTAVNNGTVTVTATSVANSAITGTMDIAVVNQVIPVTGITVASPADTIKVAGGTLQMAASVLPVNATNVAITWSVDAPAVATISADGLLTAVASGTVIVRATSVSTPAVSGSKTIIVTIPVGVPSVDAVFTLYPVPVESQLFITSSVAIERVEVLSIVGRTLISGALVGNAVDMSALPAGTYIVRVHKVNGDIVVRTIIKN